MLIDCKECGCTAIAGDLPRCPMCSADLTAKPKAAAGSTRPVPPPPAPPKDAA